jgi:hypothetical protein
MDMPPLITQFWVVSQEGICYFHRNIAESLEDKDDQNNLLGGFFSAILSFAQQLTSSNIEKFESSGSKYLFFTDKNLIFVVESPIGTADKVIQKKI